MFYFLKEMVIIVMHFAVSLYYLYNFDFSENFKYTVSFKRNILRDLAYMEIVRLGHICGCI